MRCLFRRRAPARPLAYHRATPPIQQRPIHVQIKKQEVREKILEAAYELFRTRGYANTTLPQIAELAGVSKTNVYVYFDSKLSILYAIHGPWIQRQFDEVEAEVDRLAQPRDKLRRLLTALFRELPAKEGGFANNIMQAIATARPEDPYRPSLMTWLEERLLGIVCKALPMVPPEQLAKAELSHFLMMGFDGYIVFHKVAPERGCSDETIEFLCDVFIARLPQAGAEGRAERRAAAP
jgi:AcrR family transcriptional regulator